MSAHAEDSPKYTLEEARKILLREECDLYGHVVVTRTERSMSGDVVHVMFCERCEATFVEAK